MLRLTVVGWPHLHIQGSFPFLSSVPLAGFTSNFLKATFLTGLQTEPYAAFQLQSQTSLQVEGKNPETHIFCRKYKRNPRSFWQNHSLLLLHNFFHRSCWRKMALLIISYFSLMCFHFFLKAVWSPSLFQGIARIKFTWLHLCCTNLYLHLCIIGYSWPLGSCCHLWHSYWRTCIFLAVIYQFPWPKI